MRYYQTFRELSSISSALRSAERSTARSANVWSAYDSVSASHPVSNLRSIKLSTPQNESAVERNYRIKHIELQNWNHNYWLENNRQFQMKKSEFIKNELKNSKLDDYKQALSYDELALFYKSFLDANHSKHMQYNIEWYKRHLSLLWPAFNAFIARLKRQIF